MIANIDIFTPDGWKTCAVLKVEEDQHANGYRGKSLFYYEIGYATDHYNDLNAVVSLNYPVNFERINLPHWPAFILDLLPSGAARREMLHDFNLPDNAKADWELLFKGAGNPIGNLRIKEAKIGSIEEGHPGFVKQDILDRGEDFIEYAKTHGAPVSGSSGAQGDAPKFLLSEDEHGRWHADGVLSDLHVCKHWIIKFPRGKKDSDRRVLKNEGAYYRVADQVGLYVGELIEFEEDTLFIPRFDREVTQEGVERLHIESLCSLAGIAEYGARLNHNALLEVIAKFSTDIQADIEEYVLRDILNVAMGNTDNHTRNTAMRIKDNSVRLTPLYDFAPMILDDQGIARSCRWDGELENNARPDWGLIVNAIEANKNIDVDTTLLRERIIRFYHRFTNINTIMSECGVDEALIAQLGKRIDEVQLNLKKSFLED